MKKISWIGGIALIAAFLAAPGFAQEYSGAFYVGDANGNGIIEPTDIQRAQQHFATGAADYSQVQPPAWDVAELSGNGFIDSPDFTILQYWYLNLFPARNGEPAALTAVGDTTMDLFAGESVVVCVVLKDEAGVGDPFATERAGWGVNFAVDQTPGLCTTAAIYGRNPWGTAKDEYGYYQKAYEYTDRIPPNGTGQACVRVVAPMSGCDGLDIKVDAYVPDDSEALCNGLPFPCYGTQGRSPSTLAGPTFTFNGCYCEFLTLSPNPAAVNDGQTVQLTATDSVFGDVTADPLTDWSVVSGPCTVGNMAPDKGLVSAAEGCADAECQIEAVFNGIFMDAATVNVTDDEAGTWDALRTTVCSEANDIVNPAASCTTPQRYSSADDCDRGPANCSWSCTGDCGELCMPTTSGAYTGRCTDGAVFSEDVSTVINNETTATVDVTPEGPIELSNGDTINFACMATYADSCTRSCDSALYDLAGCGSLSGTIYTMAGSPCTDVVSATMDGGSDGETIGWGPGPYPWAPNILTVFPLQGQPGIPQRNWQNAHTDQVLTAVLQAEGSGVSQATSVTATCTGPSTVNFTCDLSNYTTDLDIPCTPTSAFLGSGAYSCTVTATNPTGSDVVTANMYTAMNSAPTDGGHAGGYVGGNLWDSTTNTCDPGNVNICAANMQTNAAVLEKVYVQIRQTGQPVVERFTSAATGCVTVSLPCRPIDELHLGFKCGLESCPKLEDGATWTEYKNNLERNYAYLTETALDANDLVLRMPLMSDGAFYRWKQRIQGTIGENYFSAYIGPRTTGADGGVKIRDLFLPPVRLRAVFVITTLAGMKEAAGGMDLLLLSSDYEVSISLCLMKRNSIDIALPAALPPNLIIPELVRSDWSNGCGNYSVNPGKYSWEYWSYGPNQYRNVMSVGVYANATNFTLTGGLDLFAFPMDLCALGFYGVTNDANLTGDPIRHIGTNAGFRYDIRENWDNTPLGFDPDGAVNRKVLFTFRGKAFPIDPARQNALLRPVATYRVPNLSDSELIGDATWDDRFYRKNVGVISAASFGLSGGIGVTGLSLSCKIDDLEFTMFHVGYLQSTPPKIGVSDVRYWSSSSTDSEVVSSQQAGIASNWTNPSGTNINFAPIDTGGPSNYIGISVLMRPFAIDGQAADADMTSGEGRAAATNPGSILGVWHVGPLQNPGNENIAVAEFLNMPLAQAPGPDEYLYPGAQWLNDAAQTGAINRNGELWRYITAGADDAIPSAGGRYYFQFSRPAFQYNPSRAVHQWLTQLTEPGYFVSSDPGRKTISKRSIKSRVSGRTGSATGANEFNDTNVRYQSWGVAAGDTLWVDSRAHGCLNTRLLITGVPAQTQVTVSPDWGTGINCIAASDTGITYRIFRANPRGECLIDEGYGGGPAGYICKSNTFWQASGPADTGAIRVYAPTVTPGPRTLAGTTGYVPGFWDGITANDVLEWNYSVLVFNTGAATVGGLGGPFDWNNWETRPDELSIEHGALDGAVVIRQ